MLASKAAWGRPGATVEPPELADRGLPVPGVTVSQESLWLEMSWGSPRGRREGTGAGCGLAGAPEAVAASGCPPGLVRVGPLPWSALRPGLASMCTKGVVPGAHVVLLGAVAAATVWGCGEEEEFQGVRVEGSGSADPVALPLRT